MAVSWVRPWSGVTQQVLEALNVAPCQEMPGLAVARLLGVSDDRV